MPCRRKFEIEKGTKEAKYDTAKDVVITTALRRAEQRRPKEDEIMAVERRRQESDGERWAEELENENWWGMREKKWT